MIAFLYDLLLSLLDPCLLGNITVLTSVGVLPYNSVNHLAISILFTMIGTKNTYLLLFSIRAKDFSHCKRPKIISWAASPGCLPLLLFNHLVLSTGLNDMLYGL